MELSADVFMTELQLAVRIRGFLICKYIVRMSSFFGCKIVFFICDKMNALSVGKYWWLCCYLTVSQKWCCWSGELRECRTPVLTMCSASTCTQQRLPTDIHVLSWRFVFLSFCSTVFWADWIQHYVPRVGPGRSPLSLYFPTCSPSTLSYSIFCFSFSYSLHLICFSIPFHSTRIVALHFQVGCCMRWLNLAVVFCVSICVIFF